MLQHVWHNNLYINAIVIRIRASSPQLEGGRLRQRYIPLSQVSSLMTDRWCHKGNEIWIFFWGWSLASLKNKYFKKIFKNLWNKFRSLHIKIWDVCRTSTPTGIHLYFDVMGPLRVNNGTTIRLPFSIFGWNAKNTALRAEGENLV